MRASIIILAGGRSRRFGTDKAAFRIGGGTLLERTASAARETGLPVTVVGRRRPDPWPWPDVGFQPDEVPDLGPMGGLITGLRAAGTSVLAVGCDMPLLTPRALGWLAGEAGASGAEHGLVTFLEGGG
ncbi:MAG: molybdenum cofactor guanylyltransferase, partial [bacterium]